MTILMKQRSSMLPVPMNPPPSAGILSERTKTQTRKRVSANATTRV
jgi:hypothetical protein